MSKHHKPVAKPEVPYTTELQSVAKAPVSGDPAPVANAWVVLEDRTVAISGSITKVRTGKVVRDRLIAEALVAQGVKMEARAV